MVVRQLGSTLRRLLIRSGQYVVPVIRIYTRTFITTRHKYTEGYIQIITKNVQHTKPVAFRYVKGSELVQRLTAVAFDIMSDHLSLQEWYAYQWESLCSAIVAVVEAEYRSVIEAEVESSTPTGPVSIDSYIIEDKIGDVSTCAAVYRAVRDEEHVALKAMFNFSCEGETDMMRFENFGAELLTSETSLPSHPNVIRINAHFVSSNVPHSNTAAQEYPAVFQYGYDDTLYIEMPLYTSSLRQYLRKATLSEDDVIWVLHQMTSAVHHIASHNIVHRDIRLANILLKEQAGSLDVVLTDFGMAHDSLLTPNHPHGRKWGNPMLMPPEIGCSTDSSAPLDYTKSDIWCVGTVVYELLGAANPFSKLSSRSYRSHDLPALPTRDSVLANLVSNLLSVSPDSRLTPHQTLMITGVMVWLPGLLGGVPSVEDVARELALLSWDVIRDAGWGGIRDTGCCAGRMVMLVYFLRHASAAEICSAVRHVV